jgi:hypothetical protein
MKGGQKEGTNVGIRNGSFLNNSIPNNIKLNRALNKKQLWHM